MAKRIGAMMVLMRRRKILLKTARFGAKAGKLSPTSTPTSILTRIQVVRDFFFIAKKITKSHVIHLLATSSVFGNDSPK